MSPAPVLSRADLTCAADVPEAGDRRRMFRTLAEEVEDFPAPMVATMLRRWADPALSPADREQAWERLTSAVALLDALHRGAVEPSAIVPGAPRNAAHTIAAEVLEEDTARALDTLLGKCPDASDDGVRYTGRRHPDTNEEIEAGPCRRRFPDGVDFFGLSL